jgi:hypothetical protein
VAVPVALFILTGMLTAFDPLPASPPGPAPTSHHHVGRPFLSPMGEPFPVRAPGDDTLADWFDQADRNRDGFLTVAEMQLDADRFFAVLDTNHDSEIDPDEITRYEQVIAPDGMAYGARLAEMNSADPRLEGRHGGHRHGGGQWGGRGHGNWGDDDARTMGQGRARFGLFDLPEPVAAADVDLSRGISPDEFRKAAQLRFQALDVTHQGRLTLDVLETLRPPPPTRPKQNLDEPSGIDANTDTGG